MLLKIIVISDVYMLPWQLISRISQLNNPDNNPLWWVYSRNLIIFTLHGKVNVVQAVQHKIGRLIVGSGGLSGFWQRDKKHPLCSPSLCSSPCGRDACCYYTRRICATLILPHLNMNWWLYYLGNHLTCHWIWQIIRVQLKVLGFINTVLALQLHEDMAIYQWLAEKFYMYLCSSKFLYFCQLVDIVNNAWQPTKYRVQVDAAMHRF